ncbi:MAG: MFS transporter [Eubacteriaceae bacterium]|nr:MFS transporter [Eubacteriaceae bacterium]
MTDSASMQKTMPKSFPYLWMFHSAGQMFGLMVAMQFMNLFWQNSIGLTPAFIATFLTIARSIDLFMSIIAGPIVQKTNTKMGQFRPWVLGSAIVVQIGVVLMFINPNIPNTAKGIIAGLGYLLQNAPMNFFVAANNGIMAKVVGADMEGRRTVQMRSMQGTNASSIIINATMLPLITYFNQRFDPMGYLIVAVIFGALWIVSTTLVFIMTKDYDEYIPGMVAANTPKLSEIYKDVIKNSQIWVLFIQNLITMVTMFAIGALNMYYWMYSVGDMKFQPIAATLASVTGLIASFTIAPIGRKLKKKNAVLIATGWSILCSVAHGFFSHGQPYVYMVIATLSSLGMGLSQSVGITLWLDAAEKQLYETGIDTRAATMSVSSIGMKIAMVAAAPITPYLFKMIGFIQDFDENTGALLGTRVLYPERIAKVWFWTSAAISAVSLAIFFFGYTITDEEAAMYATENQKRMMERMGAMGGPGPGGPPPGGPGGPPPGGPSPGAAEEEEEA